MAFGIQLTRITIKFNVFHWILCRHLSFPQLQLSPQTAHDFDLLNLQNSNSVKLQKKILNRSGEFNRLNNILNGSINYS